MKEVTNLSGQVQFVNPVGLRIAEPFTDKSRDAKVWIRLVYTSREESLLVGPFESMDVALAVVRSLY